jgi:hypothetical protein
MPILNHEFTRKDTNLQIKSIFNDNLKESIIGGNN